MTYLDNLSNGSEVFKPEMASLLLSRSDNLDIPLLGEPGLVMQFPFNVSNLPLDLKERTRVLLEIMNKNSTPSMRFGDHGLAVEKVSTRMMGELGRSVTQADSWGKVLHDIGKIGETIYDPNRRFQEDDYKIMRHHPVKGYLHLHKLGFDEKVARWPLVHHNSNKYPPGLEVPDYLRPDVDALEVADIAHAMGTRPNDGKTRPLGDVFRHLVQLGAHKDDILGAYWNVKWQDISHSSPLFAGVKNPLQALRIARENPLPNPV